MTEKKAVAAAESEPKKTQYEEAVDQVAAAIRKFIEAGVGGQAAGQLACDLYCKTKH